MLISHEMKRALSAVFALSVALAPIMAQAQDPGAEGPDPQELFQEGKNLYETADYDGAIEKWTKAYGLVEDTAQNAEIKTALLYNIAGAHSEAYEIDGDITHLNKAKVLLQRFSDNIEQLYEGDQVEAEKVKIQDKLDEIQAKLDENKAAEPAPPEPGPQPEPGPEPEPAQPVDNFKPAKPMLIAGGVLLGLGVVGVGLGIMGGVRGMALNNDFTEEELEGATSEDLADRRTKLAQGTTSNILAGLGYGVGIPAAITGAVLLGIGASRKAKNERLEVSGTFGPGGGLVTLGGRF